MCKIIFSSRKDITDKLATPLSVNRYKIRLKKPKLVGINIFKGAFNLLIHPLYVIMYFLKNNGLTMIYKKLTVTSLSLCFLFSLFINPVALNAWNETGHKIIAAIAWDNLTPIAKENIIEILKVAPKDSDLLTLFDKNAPSNTEQYFLNVAYWPDMVRDRNKTTRYKKYHEGNWHYIGSYWKQTPGGPVEATGLVEKENVAERISYFQSTLASAEVSNEIKAVQIAWVLHLIGDIHNPLHNASRVTTKDPDGDRGGNSFALADKWPTNLHSFWDGIIDVNSPKSENTTSFDYYTTKAKEISSKHPKEEFGKLIQVQDPSIWTKEGKRIVMDSLYPETLIEGQKPSIEYQEKSFEIAQQRMALSGYRMAEFLNAIFN